MASRPSMQLAFAFWAVMAMLMMPYDGSFSQPVDSTLEEDWSAHEVITVSNGFNASDGFTPSNITVDSTDGTPVSYTHLTLPTKA